MECPSRRIISGNTSGGTDRQNVAPLFAFRLPVRVAMAVVRVLNVALLAKLLVMNWKFRESRVYMLLWNLAWERLCIVLRILPVKLRLSQLWWVKLISVNDGGSSF